MQHFCINARPFSRACIGYDEVDMHGCINTLRRWKLSSPQPQVVVTAAGDSAESTVYQAEAIKRQRICNNCKVV